MEKCKSCDHRMNPLGGHCYLFDSKPEDCSYHSQGLGAGAIGSVRHSRGSSLLHALMGIIAKQNKGGE